MKKVVLAVVLGVALAFLIFGQVWADSLVCDPYPADVQVQGFRGSVIVYNTSSGMMDGIAFDTPYALHASGAAIVYDCSSLGSGKWDFVNVRAYNVRGESIGVGFTYPALPGSPANLRKVE